MLGLSAWKNLYHVLIGECNLEDVIVDGPHGIKIIPAAPGARDMASLSLHEHVGIIDSISQLTFPIDYFVIDIAAGIGNSVCLFSQIANNIVVVLCDEPASIADAYALIKILCNSNHNTKFKILTNMVDSNAHAEKLFNQFYKICTHFLDVTLEHCGYIPIDEYMKRAIQKQKSVIDVYPGSRSAFALKRIAKSIEKWPKPKTSNGSVELFLERHLLNRRSNKVKMP